MQINRLRLVGFKSFVEPTDLVIERGLTGVVGPNGCGKSNLLEALRWVMGETSYKSMRGSAMDDVIFSGTNGRPARAVAEVTIFVDNRSRKAPAEFNDSDTIEITRRIERELGSAYRINGREARARDVKLVFEDAATGARSPALVRQGQIAEIVNAKPEQRRRVLEDAAGIAGLHTRRHEAELRLNAAESNLARLGDILGQMTSQMDGLKRQVRQARRYKELSAEVRKLEALLCHLLWTEAQFRVDESESEYTNALTVQSVATEAEARALREEADAAAGLQPLRDEEAQRAAALARIASERDRFDRDIERAAARVRELEARVAQLDADLAHETALGREAQETVARLEAELASERASMTDAASAGDNARADLARAETARSASEARLSEVTAAAFEARSERRSLETALGERREQVRRLEKQLVSLETQRREIAGRAPDVQKLVGAQAECKRLADDLVDIEAAQPDIEQTVRSLAAEAKARHEDSRQATLAASRLKVEADTLAKLLAPARDGNFTPVFEAVEVAPGYELALGAALGDDLEAPTTPEAPAHWRDVGSGKADGALPDEVEPLSTSVTAPPELARRLRQIGVVDREMGPRLQPGLQPGQRLVSRDGDLWRWDGFVATRQAAVASAQRLLERNRLAGLLRREADARAAAEAATAADQQAAEAYRRAEAGEQTLRRQWRENQAMLAKARESLTAIERAARDSEMKLSTVNEAKDRVAASFEDAVASAEETEAALAVLGPQEPLAAELEAAQKQAESDRIEAASARNAVANLEREASVRTERIAMLDAECQRWSQRANSAREQVAAFEARHAVATAELREAAQAQPVLQNNLSKLADALAEAKTARADAADALAAGDSNQRAAAQTLRAAQASVGAAREERARTEARLESARARRAEEGRKIRESLNVAPDECLKLAGVAAGTKLPPSDEISRQLDRLKADRERLGGVNLQAEEELEALAARHASSDKERADIEGAIQKLRGGIAQLNREAKKRLLTAFEAVNGHFQALFTTLFGGGEARLELLDNDDPMGGGLEIIAKPPGKKPATLSLLSGGEQTLTALSLIFAVFLTNPSPICVLDEVDAPLDDANVDRFCTLMEKMAADTATRFLVITHHPMTMARMQRLFGVTMAEKGVSQLVSVDLQEAQRYREAS